nr:MAG TPA: hypothetical protein [Caudoviricetes sp.]
MKQLNKRTNHGKNNCNASNFVNDFINHRCDVFDYAILEHCKSTQRLNIISDDSDFSTMDKIILYTANEKVLHNT